MHAGIQPVLALTVHPVSADPAVRTVPPAVAHSTTQSFFTADLTFAPTKRVTRDETGPTSFSLSKSLMLALTSDVLASPPHIKK